LIAENSSDHQHISEEELQARLAEQSRRAVLAEEFIVHLEQQRLIALGCPEYAACVQRVSKYDVAAGYDILSFNADGEPQHLEVKSSVGRRSFFVFTRNEMRVASEKRATLSWFTANWNPNRLALARGRGRPCGKRVASCHSGFALWCCCAVGW
ncbi:MAG: DUF3883 domain-containing protein, partial [Planctomycetaceae bacterium]|nr:DUF3883 domain-containing protein [Planctomycetaceae bacterium]